VRSVIVGLFMAAAVIAQLRPTVGDRRLFRDVTHEAGITFEHHASAEKRFIVESTAAAFRPGSREAGGRSRSLLARRYYDQAGERQGEPDRPDRTIAVRWRAVEEDAERGTRIGTASGRVRTAGEHTRPLPDEPVRAAALAPNSGAQSNHAMEPAAPYHLVKESREPAPAEAGRLAGRRSMSEACAVDARAGA
jgi:hypothetical protein